MDTTQLSSKELVNSLSDGWTMAHWGLAQQMVRRLYDKLNAEGDVHEVAANTVSFSLRMKNVHLRGFDDVMCLLLAYKDTISAEAIRQLVRKASRPGLMTFVFALSRISHEAARDLPLGAHSVVFSPEDVCDLLETREADASIKHTVRQRVSRRSLIPYSLLKPVQGAMFYGRNTELSRLLEEEDTSFAIAGPSRIGKSSILKEYARRLVCESDPRATRVFEISMYDCPAASDDRVPRHLAMGIDPSRRSSEIMMCDLLQFLCRERSRYDGPLELLLDEVDETCNGKAFELLGDAAKRGICRLVLAGKGVLLNSLLSQKSPLSCRVELIRPEPLDEASARQLILEPLADLGFGVDKPDLVVNEVFRLTGRLPHLLQFYGKKLTELAIDEKAARVSLHHIDKLKWEYETARYFISPLNDLPSDDHRKLALALLRDGRQVFAVSDLEAVAEGCGTRMPTLRVVDVCNDLVISNVLAWNSGQFSIANEALPHYARELGLLEAGQKHPVRRVGAVR